MKFINTVRLVLVGVLFILGTMLVQAHPGSKDSVIELQKKAIYFDIKAQLAAGRITLAEAQSLWKIRVKHLKKEEAK